MGRVNSRPLVAIVGRPNVGKSTLFNRFVGERAAIVDDMPGVTRDRLYLPCEWQNREFIVIDTGGLIFGKDEDELNASVQEQAWLAVDEAEVIVFVVDGETGLHPVDNTIANLLRQRSKSVILAVNKIDEISQGASKAAEFYELGLGDPHPISAIHRHNTGDLLDNIVQLLDLEPTEPSEESGLRIAIVGKPNVGKSSIVNTLLGVKRMAVSDVSGTTRDATDSVCKYNGQEYILIDTAGIRKKSKVRYGIERFSVVRAIKAIERADVVVLVLDASDTVSEQDQRIAGMAQDLGKASLIVVNKWDLIEDKTSRAMNEHADSVRDKLYFMNYAPILFVSAVTKKRLLSIFDLAQAASEENQRRITTGLLNEVLNEIVSMTPPPSRKSKMPRISYATQVAVQPPSFVLFSNHPNLIEEPYLRHIERKMRESFGFSGTPLRFFMREDAKRKARGEARRAGGAGGNAPRPKFAEDYADDKAKKETKPSKTTKVSKVGKTKKAR